MADSAPTATAHTLTDAEGDTITVKSAYGSVRIVMVESGLRGIVDLTPEQARSLANSLTFFAQKASMQ